MKDASLHISWKIAATSVITLTLGLLVYIWYNHLEVQAVTDKGQDTARIEADNRQEKSNTEITNYLKTLVYAVGLINNKLGLPPVEPFLKRLQGGGDKATTSFSMMYEKPNL
jgi:hypothetical protein